MATTDLQRLIITNLRGYVQTFSLDFDQHRRLCIVYGENGSGKSTLCDALDLLGTDNVGSLDGRGLGKTERFLSPLGKTGPGTIELRTTRASYAVQIEGERVSRGKDASRPLVQVLRRPQVLNIVNATAARRYQAIADLVDVVGVEVSEQSLARLAKDAGRHAEESAARLAGARQVFEDLVGSADIAAPAGIDALRLAAKGLPRFHSGEPPTLATRRSGSPISPPGVPDPEPSSSPSLDTLDDGARARVESALSSYWEDYEIADRAAKLAAAVRKAHEIVLTRRRIFVNELLRKIAEEVGTLYERVHPGEGLGRIAMELDPAHRASLDLKTSFQGAAAVPPQAYLSDSHLDTLGVCVFIALARRRQPSDTILILDDVLGSMDEPHVDRLVEMICEEADRFRHVLVTTHYRPWREKLRWGWLKQGQCQVVELGRWSPGTGPTLVRSTSEIERLRDLVKSNSDLQATCAKAGVVLEALLDFVTELYQCKLPRKSRNEWTLGDLLPAIGKRLRAALRVEQPDPSDSTVYVSRPLGPIIEELQRVAQTRNLLGAHFNKFSFEMLDSDAGYFASKVLELADLIVHPEHGWPRSDKSGSYWATTGETRRLHPLKEPT